jgi:hypothetical protein
VSPGVDLDFNRDHRAVGSRFCPSVLEHKFFKNNRLKMDISAHYSVVHRAAGCRTAVAESLFTLLVFAC